MQESLPKIDINRLSVISAAIVLAYGLVPFVQIPPQNLTIRFPWAMFNFEIDFGTIVSILVAVLAAMGSDWLLQSHPKRTRRPLLEHGLVPALSAWLIGVPLATLEVGIEWWILVGLGSIFLALILVAEFLVVDPQGSAHLPASLGLTTVSFTLFLVLAIAIDAAQTRLFLMLPAIFITLFFLVARSLFLRTGGDWNWFWSAGIAFFVSQIALGLHYLPVEPLTFGLILVGLAYPLTLLVIGLKADRKGFDLFVEPGIFFVFIAILLVITNV